MTLAIVILSPLGKQAVPHIMGTTHNIVMLSESPLAMSQSISLLLPDHFDSIVYPRRAIIAKRSPFNLLIILMYAQNREGCKCIIAGSIIITYLILCARDTFETETHQRILILSLDLSRTLFQTQIIIILIIHVFNHHII